MWRPELWSVHNPALSTWSAQSDARLSDNVAFFHDSDKADFTLRQVQNKRHENLGPYGLRLDVCEFNGSYVSLAIDLPENVASKLTRTDIIRLDAAIGLEKPLTAYGRLNLEHGPNLEKIVCGFPDVKEGRTIEFDLAYSDLGERPVERAWLDIIFEYPQMNRISLRDLVFISRPRAQF